VCPPGGFVKKEEEEKWVGKVECREEEEEVEMRATCV